jgi:hypothetical protein
MTAEVIHSWTPAISDANRGDILAARASAAVISISPRRTSIASRPIPASGSTGSRSQR